MLIYGIKNKESGETVYIGQTTRSLSSRWNQHVRDSAKLQYPLYRSIRKYGVEKFEAYFIEECSSLENMDLREIELIKQFNTLTPNGYNLMLGQRGGRHSEETKKKLSVSAKSNGLGTWERTEEDNQANKEKGIKQWSNLENREKLLIANGSKQFNVYRAIVVEPSKRNKKAVIEQGEYVGTWLSSVDCAKELQIKASAIRQALLNLRKTHKGLIFRYKEI